jgi:hypothetical protein
MQAVSNQNVIPLLNEAQLENAQAHLMQQAASTRDATIAIAELVLICALPILSPLIPPLLELTLRVASAPFVLLHHVIAVNYTLLKYDPPDFIMTAIKANLLLLKGFFFDHFSLSTTDCTCFQEWRDSAQRDFVRMLVYCIVGSTRDVLEENVARRIDVIEENVARRGVYLPRFYNCDADLDLIELNHNVLEPLVPPRLFNSGLNNWRRYLNNWGREHTTNPPPRIDPREPRAALIDPREPRAALPVEPLEQKFAPFHIRRNYFAYRVPNREIPELPSGFDLFAQFDQYCAHVDASWDNSVQINDDNVMRDKASVFFNIRNFINSIEEQARANFEGLNYAESMRTIRNALGQVVRRFMERKVVIDDISDVQEKQKALNAWLLEGRSFVMSLGASCHHCIDRKLCDAIIFFERHVTKKTCSVDDIDTRGLENHIFDMLKEHRLELVQHACTNSIETNEHHAATERFVKSQLNRELGLGLPASLGARDALTDFAIQNKVQEVRNLFFKLYTPQSIVKDFIKKTTKQMNEGSSKVYMKITEWFERQDPPKSAEDIFNVDETAFKEEAILQLFTSLGVISKDQSI